VVAIAHRDADKFVAGSLDHIHVLLLFGTDAGLISERTNAILRRCGLNPANPDQVTRFEGDDLAVNPGQLYDESHGIGLFAEKRAIIVRTGSRQIIGPIETALESPVQDCKIIIQAGQLRRDAPLRKLFERPGHAASIECYPDQTRDIERLVDQSMKEAGLQIEPAARAALIALLGDDRLSTRGEIEKLVLYAHGRKQVTEADVIEAVADASAFATDQIIYAAFSGDMDFLGEDGTQVYINSGESFALLAAAMRHALMLHQIIIEAESGVRADDLITRYAGRTVFGARKDALIRQIKQWRRTEIALCIEELSRTTLDTRREANLASSIVMQTLLMVARRFRALRNGA
jgi:DNA polymerase-3 subunit delta